ncbi:hypothetical protein SADUNF_Sadunf17G0065500 [Salix dunnii]|uniref:Uncharacterized protein n=1 Tax=Salix dunnii TaxID=1413687 RepID=A0A835J6T9_9ROSI|nr:hypothetical protein SADUNF_Sadunf17G0065500 [Salix dunnii]
MVSDCMEVCSRHGCGIKLSGLACGFRAGAGDPLKIVHVVSLFSRLRACALNCCPAIPSLSAQDPIRLTARRGSCVAYPL